VLCSFFTFGERRFLRLLRGAIGFGWKPGIDAALGVNFLEELILHQILARPMFEVGRIERISLNIVRVLAFRYFPASPVILLLIN